MRRKLDNGWALSVINDKYSDSGDKTFEIAAFNEEGIWWDFKTSSPFKKITDNSTDMPTFNLLSGWAAWDEVVAFVATIKAIKQHGNKERD